MDEDHPSDDEVLLFDVVASAIHKCELARHIRFTRVSGAQRLLTLMRASSSSTLARSHSRPPDRDLRIVVANVGETGGLRSGDMSTSMVVEERDRFWDDMAGSCCRRAPIWKMADVREGGG